MWLELRITELQLLSRVTMAYLIVANLPGVPLNLDNLRVEDMFLRGSTTDPYSGRDFAEVSPWTATYYDGPFAYLDGTRFSGTGFAFNANFEPLAGTVQVIEH